MREDKDGGWRWRLLKLAYGMDAIERKVGVPEAEIRKHKDNYRKLLDYMDDYWRTPNGKRVITPQMMRNLRAQRGTFMPIKR